MKKIILIISFLFLITGCTNINNMSYEDLTQKFALDDIKANTIRTGYKYYLPRNMQVVDSSLYNEAIEDKYNVYYLYVDVVSYFKKQDSEYKINDKAIYSTSINYDDKKGYLEINLIENNQYLVEIMYNYAKIEVIVDIKNCKQAVLSAITILKSIEYNDNVIANLQGDDILNFYEEEIDIFNTKGNTSNYITKDDNYESVEETVPDTDLLN